MLYQCDIWKSMSSMNTGDLYTNEKALRDRVKYLLKCDEIEFKDGATIDRKLKK